MNVEKKSVLAEGLLCIVIIIIGILSILEIKQLKKVVLESNFKTLQGTHRSLDFFLNLWMVNHENQISFYAKNNETRRLVEKLISYGNINDQKNLAIVKRALASKIKLDLNYDHFIIADLDCTSLASSKMIRASVDLLQGLCEDRKFWKQVKSGLFGITRPIFSANYNEPNIFVGIPVLDKENKINAVIAFKLNIIKEIWKGLSQSRDEVSKESYLVDDKGRLVSPSRFGTQLKRIGLVSFDSANRDEFYVKDPGQNLITTKSDISNRKKWPLTLAAKNIVLKMAGHNLKGYRDYRGVEVIGIWHWIDKLNIGLVTEIDYDEALKIYKRGIKRVIGIALFIICIFVIILYLFKNQLRALEDAIITAELRMSSLKRMAGGVAHEMNNPLAIIRGMGQRLKAVKEFKKDEVKRKAEKIVYATDRIKEITHKLLDYSVVGRSEKNEEIYPHIFFAVISNRYQDVLEDCKIKLSIELLIDKNSYFVGNSEKLLEVMTFLIDNSRFALKLTENPYIKISAKKFKRNIIFTIEDNGEGIKHHEADKIFDPFFSGKEKSYAKGLGLSVSKGIIESLNGTIVVGNLKSPTSLKISFPLGA